MGDRSWAQDPGSGLELWPSSSTLVWPLSSSGGQKKGAGGCRLAPPLCPSSPRGDCQTPSTSLWLFWHCSCWGHPITHLATDRQLVTMQMCGFLLLLCQQWWPLRRTPATPRRHTPLPALLPIAGTPPGNAQWICGAGTTVETRGRLGPCPWPRGWQEQLAVVSQLSSQDLGTAHWLRDGGPHQVSTQKCPGHTTGRAVGTAAAEA